MGQDLDLLPLHVVEQGRDDSIGDGEHGGGIDDDQSSQSLGVVVAIGGGHALDEGQRLLRAEAEVPVRRIDDDHEGLDVVAGGEGGGAHHADGLLAFPGVEADDVLHTRQLRQLPNLHKTCVILYVYTENKHSSSIASFIFN